MCFLCDCFCPKKTKKADKKKVKRKKDDDDSDNEMPGTNTRERYFTNWEENLGQNPNMSPSQIDDQTFSKNVTISKRRIQNRFDLFKDVLKNYSLTSKVRYEFVSEKALGKGGFGSVYRIRNVETKEVFALKAMKIRAEGNIKVSRFRAFKMEVFSLRRINHKNIIKIIDHFIVDSVFISFMILEFASEGDLNQRLKTLWTETRQPFTEPVAKGYFAQIANAINCIHNNKIAHKDLKLDNVLITKINGQEVVKVTDFGCAKVAVNGLMMDENVAGTVIYMAPEVLRIYISQGLNRPDLAYKRNPHNKTSQIYNPFKADVWSLGVCLYRLVFYNYPYNYDTGNLVDTVPPMLDAMKTGFPRPDRFAKNLSKECLGLISETMYYNKSKRLKMPEVMHHKFVITSPEADSYDKSVTVSVKLKPVSK